jgi:eukaryotic-like serine/threonine-protein kinase
MVGKRLRHYHIIRQIGAGGMGEVYLARDEHLERDVAVKVLSAAGVGDGTARSRFRLEALALSKLNHPNIATVHDFDTVDGMDFLVTEYVPGRTLGDTIAKGALADDTIVRLGAQLAAALAAAHGQGVIHRDIKPENVRVTPDDRLKVLDFGLATLRQRQTPDDSALTRSVVDLPGISGTLPYMSPEQLSGTDVDHRTDIWAAGVVLYEMATARRPFENRLTTALVADIQNKPVVPPGDFGPVSPELQQMILKCLQKDRNLRYQSALDLLADFQRLGAGLRLLAPAGQRAATTVRRGVDWRIVIPVLVASIGMAAATWLYQRRQPAAAPESSITSLAVLPLANLSGDASQEPIVEGMHEALIMELSQIRALRVISRTSAVRYKASGKPLAQIAGELNVQAVVEGSVLRSGSRMRVVAQLIQVDPERNLWSDKFDRELTDVLYLTSEVAQAIARQIRIAVTPHEQAQLVRARPVNAKAYELYVLGRHYWSERTIDGYERAIETFRRALDADSGYAPVHAALADSYMLLGEQGGLPPSEARLQSAEAIRNALALDDQLTEAHVSLAHWKFFYEWNWSEAEKTFKRAIELNPGYAAAHQSYGRTLGFFGRFDDALAALQRARDLDPLSVIVLAYTGQVDLFAGRYDRAEALLTRTLQMNPSHALVLHNVGELHLAQKRYAEAIVRLEESVEASRRRNAHYLAMLGCAYARAGRTAAALKLRQELTERAKQRLASAFDLAALHAAMGDRDAALSWLERGYQARDPWLAELKAWPWFDELAAHPRFQAVMQRMNFPH